MKAGRGSNLVQFGTSYNEIVGNRIHGAPVEYVPAWETSTGTYGLYVSGKYNLFDGNVIYDNTGYGLHLFVTRLLARGVLSFRSG